MSPWTIALDDLMCHRLHCCTVCGAPLTSGPWVFGTWDVDATHVVSYVAHEKCWSPDAARRVLGPRYAPERRET